MARCKGLWGSAKDEDVYSRFFNSSDLFLLQFFECISPQTTPQRTGPYLQHSAVGYVWTKRPTEIPDEKVRVTLSTQNKQVLWLRWILIHWGYCGCSIWYLSVMALSFSFSFNTRSCCRTELQSVQRRMKPQKKKKGHENASSSAFLKKNAKCQRVGSLFKNPYMVMSPNVRS